MGKALPTSSIISPVFGHHHSDGATKRNFHNLLHRVASVATVSIR